MRKHPYRAAYNDLLTQEEWQEVDERDALREQALRNPVLVEQYRATIPAIWLDDEQWAKMLFEKRQRSKGNKKEQRHDHA